MHGVDVEGKKCGIEEELVVLLGESCPLPVTYGKYSTGQYVTRCVDRRPYSNEAFSTSRLIYVFMQPNLIYLVSLLLYINMYIYIHICIYT